jgi:hypothetical protein
VTSGARTLVQVAADLSDRAVCERELRALADALPVHRRAEAVLLTMSATDVLAARGSVPTDVTVRPAWEWMLDD